MKKINKLFLVLVLSLLLCGCGKSEAVKSVEAMIEALGEISLESIDAIRAAEDAYETLTEEEQKDVKNYDVLMDATDTYYELVLAFKGEAVINVEAMIDALGEISLESIDAIRAAEDAYSALTEEEQGKLENYEMLVDARDAYYELALVGEWKECPLSIYDIEKGDYRNEIILLNKDMSAVGYYADNQESTWYVENGFIYFRLSESQSGYGEYHKIVEENGRIQIGESDGYRYFVTTEDFDEAFNNEIKVVDLSEMDINDYCDFYVYERHEVDEFGEPTGNVYNELMVGSKIFEDGWYYVDYSDIAIEVIIPEHTITKVYRDGSSYKSTKSSNTCVITSNPFSYILLTLNNSWFNCDEYLEITADQLSFGRTKGILYFIHEDYIKEVEYQSYGKDLILENTIVLGDKVDVWASSELGTNY